MMIYGIIGLAAVLLFVAHRWGGKLRALGGSGATGQAYQGLFTAGIALVVMVFVLALFWYAFPNWAERYIGWGGPFYALPLIAGAIGAMTLIPNARLRKIAVGVSGSMVTLAVVATLGWSLFVTPPCAEDDTKCKEKVAAAAVAEAAEQAKIESARQTATLGPGIAKKCTGLKTWYIVGKKYVLINEGGDCSGALYYDGNPTLYAKQAGSDNELGPYHRGDKLPEDAEWLRVGGNTPHRIGVALSPPRITKLVDIR